MEDIILFQDTFTEASNIALESHTPNIDTVGTGWVKVGSSGSQGISNSLQVNAADDTAIIGTGGDTQGILYAATLPDADCYMEADFIAGTGDDTHHFLLRVNNDATNYYALRFSTTVLQLVKIVAGSATQLGTGTAPTANQRVRLEVQGSVLRVYVDDVLSIKVNDTSVTDAGIACYGVGQLITSLDDMSTQKIDNFEVGNLGSVEFRDDFNVGVDTALESRTPNVGTGWTKRIGTNSMYVEFTGLFLTNNNVSSISDGVLYTSEISTAWQNDQAVAVHMRNPDSSDDPCILALRYTDTNNFYALRFNTSAFRIYKKVGGTVTALGTELGSGQVAENDFVKFQIEGTTLKAYVNDVELISLTDSSLSSGKPGIGIGNIVISNDDGSTQSFNNYWAWNLAIQYTKTVTAKARIIPIEQPTLSAPADTSTGEPTTYFEWFLPQSKGNIYSEIQIGMEEDFDTHEIHMNTWRDSGFEYWDGDSWEDYPVTGVPRQFSGNKARIQIALPTGGLKYWRVRCLTG